MRRLTLVRHAKSSWKNAALADVDRPLSGRGKRDAPRMGEYLASRGVLPDIILTSPARRARKTAQLLAAAMPAAVPILCEAALYPASAESLLERVRALDDTWQHVMLIGHNPGLTDFASQIATAGGASLPTCGVLVADLAVDSWREAGPGCGRTVLAVAPKQLPS